MPKTTRKLPGFEGVAAGQTATLRLPIGRTYEQLLITYAGATLAQLDELRIIANGDVLHRITELTKLDSLNQFNGRAAANGVIVFDFTRFNMRTRASEEVYALGTGVLDDPRTVTTLSLEIDVNAAAVGTALSAKAITSEKRLSSNVVKTRQFTYTASAAGEFEISDLPKGEAINKIYVGGHAANVYTTIEVERDNFIEFSRSVAENSKIQIDGVRTPQADFVVYDPTELGNSESLGTAGVADLRLRLGVTNAGQIPVTVEYIGTLDI